jgi:hypothetical protein
MTAPFEPGRGYRLNPAVASRPEPFGLGSRHCVSDALATLAAADMIVPQPDRSEKP